MDVFIILAICKIDGHEYVHTEVFFHPNDPCKECKCKVSSTTKEFVHKKTYPICCLAWNSRLQHK